MSDGKLEFDTQLNSHGMNDQLEKLGSKAEKASGRLLSLKGAAGKLGDSLKKVAEFAGKALVGISTGILGAGAASANVGMGFEAAMSKVGAISNASAEDMEKLNEKAKQMGATTKFSASESAEAFQYMAMAGWKADKMLGGIDGIMNLAAADGLDLATTSDIVTDALTAFGMSADESAHFADVLAAASSSANTNVTMLGESFKYAAPLAGAMGYSAEDVSVALGLMANAGVKGSMAGTALKTAIANLSSPTKAMKDQMDKLKISMTDSSENALSLREVIIQLREKFAGLSESEKSAAASAIFGKEAMSGMLAVINASDQDFKSLISNIDSADGTAKRMADTLNDNLQGDLTIAKSALEGFGIAVYDNIKDKLREAVKLGTGYIDRLSRAFTKGSLRGAVEESGKIFGDLTSRIAEKAPEMIDAAIGFTEAFCKALWNNRSKVADAVKKIVSNIKGKLIELLPKSIREPIKKAVENVEKSLGSVVGVFRNTFKSDGIKNAIAFIVQLIGKITSAINNIVKKVLPTFKTGFERLQRAFESDGFRKAVGSIVDLICRFSEIAGDIAARILPPLCDALGWVIENLDTLMPLIGTVAGAWAAWSIVNKATDWCSKFAGKAGTVIERLAGIGTEAGGAEGAAGNLIAKLLSFPGAQIAGLIGAAVSVLAIMATYLITNDDKARSLQGALDSMRKSEEKNLGSAQKVADMFALIGESADAFKQKIDSAAGSIRDFDSQIDTDRKTKLTGEMEELQKQFNDIAGYYSDKRNELTDGEIQKLEELFDKMRKLAGQELNIEMSYQEVELDLAEAFVRDFQGSSQEYADQSAEHFKVAAEARDNAIKAENALYKNELANINRMYSDPVEARQHREESKRLHEERLSSVQKNYDDTVNVIQKGYSKISDAWKNFQRRAAGFYSASADARRHYENDIAASLDYGEHAQEMRLNAQTIFNQRSDRLWKQYISDFTETEVQDLGIWLQMVKTAQENGEQIDQDTADAVEFFLKAISQLPPETQRSMEKTVTLAESILAPLPEDMKRKAGEASAAWVNGIADIPEKTAEETERIKLAISDSIGPVPTQLQALGQELVSAYAVGISSQFSINEIEKAAEAVKAALRMSLISDELSVRGAAGELGRMVAQGYVDGVKSQLSILPGVGSLLAGTVLTGIQTRQQSHSPSRVAIGLGEDLSEGYVMGIESGKKDAALSASTLTDAVLSVIRNAGQGIGRIVSDGGLSFFRRVNREVSGTDIVSRMRAAAAGSLSGISGRLSGVPDVTVQDSGGRLLASGNIEAHLNIDGREFAVVTAPFMNEELAFIRG